MRRGERVHATDGDIGRVQGLIIDPSDHHVTHVLLQEGHLWGKKEVAIPMGSVKEVDAEGVHLDLSGDEVKDLPPVALADRLSGAARRRCARDHPSPALTGLLLGLRECSGPRPRGRVPSVPSR